jgi:hypothetical protein
MSISGKQAAKAFRKKYGILNPSLDEMKNVIRSQGYSIVEFNAIFNDEDVALIIENLRLDNLISERKGFTYADSKNRLVFVHEDLSVDEKLSVLLHEEGHIFCGHIEENTYLGRDIQQEVEANEFAYCVQYPTATDKSAFFVKKNKVWLSIVSVILAVSLISLAWFMREKELYGEYVITKTGNKYHQSDCIHVKNKTNTHRLTVEQFESGEYEPCGTCLPQG